MAVPTIINILPPEAPTSGRKIIEIFGSNFRTLSPIGPGNVTEPSPSSVEVLFDDIAAEEVQVIRSNLLRVLPPISPLPGTKASGYGAGTVDLKVRNIFDTGDPIPGEEVTLADGFEYKHPGLDTVTTSELARLIETLVADMKKQIIPNVLLSQSTEFDDDTSDGFNITQIGELPALVLTGPDIPENRFYSVNENQFVPRDSGSTYEIRHPHTVDVKFGLIGITNQKHVLVNFMAMVSTYMRRNKIFKMLRCKGDISQGFVEYELDFDIEGGLRARTQPNNSNIQSFIGSIVIRGFNIEGFAGFDLDEVVNIGSDVDVIDFTLTRET